MAPSKSTVSANSRISATIHQKSGIGRLSAYCGAVSAGVGAGAGIAYLLDGSPPRYLAYRTTGTEAVMPWLPEPERITTGSSHPLIRASLPAAAHALASVLMSLGYSASITEPISATW